MRKLSVAETIQAGRGHAWYVDWENQRSGGTMPADCNLPLMCLADSGGRIFSLIIDQKSTISGGTVDWTCRPASEKLAGYVKKIM
jgi:hypothetical protein